MFGRVGEFDEAKEEWPQYVEWLGHFFEANGITEEGKQRSIFLTVIGPTVFKLLRNLVSPEKPGDKSYQDLVKVLTEHFKPVRQRQCKGTNFIAGVKSQENRLQRSL